MFSRSSDRIEVFTKWPCAGGLTNYKTPTIALFGPDSTFWSFGSEALDDHNRLKSSEQKDCYFFTDFKMNLYKNIVRVSCFL